MSEIRPQEIELARERIKAWPLGERMALTRMTEKEVRTIMLAVALLDIRPLEGGEAAAPTSAPTTEASTTAISESSAPPSSEPEPDYDPYDIPY